jgi:transposase
MIILRILFRRRYNENGIYLQHSNLQGCDCIMNEIGAIIKSARELIPAEVQDDFIAQLGISETLDASPVGAILMGMYVLEYAGFPKYIDEIVGEEHTTIEQLRNHYHNRTLHKMTMVPSTGIILSLLAADMIACPRSITPGYKFEEMAEQWHTGPLLGIEPSLLNDDRIGRAMSKIGTDAQNLQEVLFSMIVDAREKTGIPLSKFILDTTLLELDGKFKDAPKVVPGRGTSSFSQLIVSLVIASGSRMPVGFGVLPGNTSDSTTLPSIYGMVNRIADEGPVEFLMDRIFPTPGNILFLRNCQNERMVYWVAPLKIGLSEKRVRELIDEANCEGKWKAISYRSTKEVKANIDRPLTAFETKWVLTEKIKPKLEPGQTRCPRGSIQTVEVEVRCVFYRHEINAEREKENREIKKEQLEKALLEFLAKLNKRKYRDIGYCNRKLSELLKSFAYVQKFVNCSFSQSDNGAISLTWWWDEAAIEDEAKYDGIFALLTNYTKEQVNMNQLVKKYRGRDQIEVNFKEMRGILDLERVLYHRPERIDTYVFLKVIALFILTFLRSYAEQKGIKTTEKKIQESMGDMLLVENRILPLNMKVYGVARDTRLNRLYREIFSLPDPIALIKVLSETEVARVDDYVRTWYESWLNTDPQTQ